MTYRDKLRNIGVPRIATAIGLAGVLVAGGATPTQAFWRVMLPLAMPGIVAAALLSFSLSFDDFIVSNFTSGQSVTFPIYIYGAKLKEFPPQLFVVGTIMFLVSFVFVIAGEVWRRRKAAALR